MKACEGNDNSYHTKDGNDWNGKKLMVDGTVHVQHLGRWLLCKEVIKALLCTLGFGLCLAAL